MVNEKQIKTGLIKLLKKKNKYDKVTDDQLIDSLIFNFKLIEDSKDDILKRGTMIDIGKDRPFYQINFSISIFHNAVKSINTILKQLGLEKIKVDETATVVDPIQQLNEFLNKN